MTTPDDLTEILEETYKDLAKQVRVPGFRQGKVPRQVIDSHLGAEYVRSEAVRNGLPDLYVMGMKHAELTPVSDPEIEIIEVGDDGSCIFTAKVDLKPEVTVTDYKGIKVSQPSREVTDEDLEAAIDEARDRFATLEPMTEDRAIEKGDYVQFDYSMLIDGEPAEGAEGTDYMTEVGTGDFLEGFDDQLVGSRKGDEVEVTIDFPEEHDDSRLAGKTATFKTRINEIKTKVLPELDDDLASQISSCETVEIFKADLRARLAEVKASIADQKVKNDIIEALLESTEIDVPDSMVSRRVQAELEEMEHELGERGMTLDQYLGFMKGSREELEKTISDRVLEGIRSELVIEAVADAEKIEFSDEEAEEFIRESVTAGGGDPDKVIKDVRKKGTLSGVKTGMRFTRTIDFLIENAEITDEPSKEENSETVDDSAAE